MKRLMIAVSILALNGCTTDPVVGQRYSETIPTCHATAECESKWAAARTWVINNADMKFQTYSADYMDTYNPPESSTQIAAQVNKAPIADGGFMLMVKVWCDNPFGCGKSIGNLMQSFNDYVNASYKVPSP